MKVTYTPTTRGDFLDRNPSAQFLSYQASNVAPHADTVRATYTVPSGKRAYLYSDFLQVFRMTAATSLNTSMAWLNVNRSLTDYPIDYAFIYNNTVGADDHKGFAPGIFLEAGDVITLHTADNSTGGTCGYTATAQLVEFDA